MSQGKTADNKLGLRIEAEAETIKTDADAAGKDAERRRRLPAALRWASPSRFETCRRQMSRAACRLPPAARAAQTRSRSRQVFRPAVQNKPRE